jgi:Na+/H+ antiporter NhaD/arsenite permease-like protein
VAKLFAGIFVTIAPAIAMLRAGREGVLAPLIATMTHADGTPHDALYFWMTGALSSFLDNAPTYLTFFFSLFSLGLPGEVAGVPEKFLAAISLGAVFMGANSYIGNGPNFMVKAIAEEHGVKMPSFFGYMAYSMSVLMPIFLLVTIIFLR